MTEIKDWKYWATSLPPKIAWVRIVENEIWVMRHHQAILYQITDESEKLDVLSWVAGKEPTYRQKIWENELSGERMKYRGRGDLT